MAAAQPRCTVMASPTDHIKRSLVKSITYRVTIFVLDFIAIYLLTGKSSIALSFTVVSNIYSTVAYYVHERIWTKIKWGAAA